MRRPLVARIIALSAVLALASACSGGGDGDAADTTGLPGSTVGQSSTTVSTTIAPTTTFIPDCSAMPNAADLSTLVGVPMSDGFVVGAGTCQFLGLNDQSKAVTLAMLTDAGDQAAWADLQASLGTPTPFDDPALAGALVGADSTLYIVTNGATYTVLTLATGASAAEQIPLSAAVLKFWLGV